MKMKLFLFIVFLATGCSEPLLRSVYPEIKGIRLVYAGVTGPNSVHLKSEPQEAQAKISYECPENASFPVSPARWDWYAAGTCENCRVNFTADLIPVKKAVSEHVKRTLLSSENIKATDAASLIGLDPAIRLINAQTAPDLDINKTVWSGGTYAESLLKSGSIQTLIKQNPDEALLFVWFYAEPSPAGTQYEHTGDGGKVRECRRKIVTAPVQDSVDFRVTQHFFLIRAADPENLAADAFEPEDEDQEIPVPVVRGFTLPSGKKGEFSADWKAVSESEFSNSVIKVFSLKGPEILLRVNQKQITDSVTEALKPVTEDYIRRFGEFTARERKEAGF